MQTRENLIHILDGYDAKLLQRLIVAEHTRLEALEPTSTPEDKGRIQRERSTLGDLFNALSVPAEVEAPRFQLIRTA